MPAGDEVSGTDVCLRAVSDDDCLRLFLWRTDSETAELSVEPAPDCPTHIEWFRARRLQRLWWMGVVRHDIAYYHATGCRTDTEWVPVGTVRLDLSGGAWFVSVTVDPWHRGYGYGRQLVETACVLAADAKISHVMARIHSRNVASLRTFRAAGFIGVRDDGDWRIYQKGA